MGIRFRIQKDDGRRVWEIESACTSERVREHLRESGIDNAKCKLAVADAINSKGGTSFIRYFVNDHDHGEIIVQTLKADG